MYPFFELYKKMYNYLELTLQSLFGPRGLHEVPGSPYEGFQVIPRYASADLKSVPGSFREFQGASVAFQEVSDKFQIT